ncbi:hypothetical protein [Nocardioides solisilvae]|uniref:hypothetical protein n=1 Tax=Nocardioides solisilvae TaxID=1542435 RepID=UPI000D74369A|nr:hypothetical protein [Nocardioides solisilvae]
MSHSAASPSLSERASSTAYRLLDGGGSASFVPHRDDADRSVAVLAHGLTGRGDLLVAVVDAEAPGLRGGVTTVRLDVRREAAEARVRVISASVHLHGTVEWLDEADHASVVAAGLRGTLGLVAAAQGVRLGAVRAERVLLHDASGVTPFPWTGLADSAHGRTFPGPDQELEAHEVVASVPDDELRALCDAVAAQRLPGRVLSDRPTRTTCSGTVGRVLVVDVDAVGVHLMRVDPDRTSVVFVQLPAPARDLEGLREQVAALQEV